MSDRAAMTSSKPYMLRALYQWIVDNGCTPYLLVDATVAGLQVPPQVVKDGQVVLNMAPEAVSAMEMGNDDIAFLTRFSGVSTRVRVPTDAAKAIYAQETGQGMVFADAAADVTSPPATPTDAPTADASAPEPGATDAAPSKGAPHLRVIK